MIKVKVEAIAAFMYQALTICQPLGLMWPRLSLSILQMGKLRLPSNVSSLRVLSLVPAALPVPGRIPGTS